MANDGATGSDARATTSPSGRRGRVIAVVAGVAAVAVAGGITWGVLGQGSNERNGGGPAADGSTTSAPADAGTVPTGPHEHADAPVVTPTAIGDVFPASIAGFEVGEIRENPEAVAAGAIAASSTTYTQGSDSLQLDAAQWADESTATARAETSFAAAGFDPATALAQGTVGQPPVGQYWYFERDGVAHLFFSEGPNDVHIEGSPYYVQEFFVQFPKPRK